MRRTPAILLLLPLFLPGCRATHTVASGTAQVVTAPAHFVGRRFHRNDQDNVPPEDQIYDAQPVSQNYQPPPPVRATPPPTVVRRTTVTSQPTAATTPVRTATPRLSPSATPAARSSTTADFPVAKPVPGKPGYVFSPFDPAGGYVDVTGYQSGAKVKDPYSQKIFLVP